LQREGEAAVLVDGDLDRDDVATLGVRRGVVRLAELHDVDAVLPECRTDRRGGVGFAGLDLQLDQPDDLLFRGHECWCSFPLPCFCSGHWVACIVAGRLTKSWRPG